MPVVGGIDGDGGGASGNLVVVLGAVSGGIGSERRGADGCPPTGGWRGGSVGAQGEGCGAQGTHLELGLIGAAAEFGGGFAGD